MNIAIKRTVASLLTAGMLLTGLTACETPQEKREENLIESFSRDTKIDFEMVVYATTDVNNGQYELQIIGYNKQEGVDDESMIKERYMQANYYITKDEANEFEEVVGDYEIMYPFSEDAIKYLKEIIRKYKPAEVKTAEIADWAYDNFDPVVEEYYK